MLSLTIPQQEFARTEIGYTVVRVVQRFERMSRYWTDDEDLLKSNIILSPKNGMRLGFCASGNDEDDERKTYDKYGAGSP